MTAAELRTVIEALQVSQIQLAESLGVTARAIGMWLGGEREIPGPVAAYLRLLLSLPRALCVKELERSRREPEMLEGMYRLDFTGHAGHGVAALVLRDGTVFGADEAGVQYDGTYEPTGASGEVSMSLVLTVPPGVTLVQGVVADHRGFSFQVGPQKLNLLGTADVTIPTPVNGPRGVVRARMSKLRNLPN
jgi:hypothetical protein